MISKLQELLGEIRELEERVSEEVSHEAEEFGYTIKQGRVSFEREIARHHKALKKRLRTYLAESSLLTMATVPVIYSLAVPLALLDLFVWVYQLLCFPVYGIPRVRRADFIVTGCAT